MSPASRSSCAALKFGMRTGLEVALSIIAADDEPLAERLPERVFSAAQVRELERLRDRDVRRDGLRAHVPRRRPLRCACIEQRWPAARSLAIVCGAGNNAGDGLVVARLAQAAGRAVKVLLVVPAERFKGAAAQAAAACRAAGIAFTPFDAARARRRRRHRRRAARHRASRVPSAATSARPSTPSTRPSAPVLALDVPSGLDADTGWPSPVAVRATATVTFLGLEAGLVPRRGGRPLRRARVRGSRAAARARRRARAAAEAARARRSRSARCRDGRAARTRARAAGCCSSAAGPACRARFAWRPRPRCASARGSSMSRRTATASRACWQADQKSFAIQSASATDLEELCRQRSTASCVGPGLGQSAWALRPVAAARADRRAARARRRRAQLARGRAVRARRLAADAASRRGGAAAARRDASSRCSATGSRQRARLPHATARSRC